MRVQPYEAHHADAWNAFVRTAKNGSFMFNRGYLDYHADRFSNDSVMIVSDGGDPIALFPASRRDDAIVSHGGLTYGGVIMNRDMHATTMLDIFDVLATHYRLTGAERLVYKAIPHIYHDLPAEEDLYALFRVDARLVRRDVSSTVSLAQRLPFSKGRAHCVKKFRRSGIEVTQSHDFATFMALEAALLDAKFGVAPVHSGAEMTLLAERFPENIKLFVAERNGLLAGVIIYESRHVAHAQYIASTDAGRDASAVDGIVEHLLTSVYPGKRYFDFGISTEDAGRHLNTGLIGNKETYGARSTVYDAYELSLAL